MFRPLEPVKNSKKSPESVELLETVTPDSKLLKDHLELELVVETNKQNGVTKIMDSNGVSQPTSPSYIMSQGNLLSPHKVDTSLFRSDGALHRPGNNKTRGVSPLARDHTENGKPVALRRLLSHDDHHHNRHHITGKKVY